MDNKALENVIETLYYLAGKTSPDIGSVEKAIRFQHKEIESLKERLSEAKEEIESRTKWIRENIRTESEWATKYMQVKEQLEVATEALKKIKVLPPYSHMQIEIAETALTAIKDKAISESKE